MENIESQERYILIRKSILGQGNLLKKNEKRDRYGSIDGVEKAETSHHPGGQGRSQRMGGMFTVNQAGIAQKMNVNKGHNEQQAEAAADLVS
jgi:hypothetical protein